MFRSCRPTRLLSQTHLPWRPTRSSCSPLGARRYATEHVRKYEKAYQELKARKAAGLGNKDPTETDKITTLSNGIRVASEDLPDAFSGVGVYIDAGSRYENDSLRGASHIMDRLAFKSTGTRSADEMLETVEQLGGNIQCASSRESMMYQAATFNSAIPTTVELLADTIRNPRLTDEEIVQQLETAEYEVGEIWSKPELILPELVHTAAFKDNTLGNPLLCPHERLGVINRDVIQAYRDAFYQPDRMVVAFAGVPHAEAVQLAEKYFGDMERTKSRSSSASSESSSQQSTPSSSTASTPPTSPEEQSEQPSGLFGKILKNLAPQQTSAQSSILHPVITPITESDLLRPATYTGGFLSLPTQPPPINPNLPTFTHIHLCFEGLPISSPDIFALATLQTLLGGGGSFSAGGPGKGMYSRLYTNVLNQHGWVESCVAFNHSYKDSGLFGIAASCYPGRTIPMLHVMCRELQALTHDSGFSALGDVEVNRAKNQLRSSLLMNLESRMVELEDLGRQVQVHGKKIPVREMTYQIHKLTPQDLRRVAKMVLGGLVRNPGGGSGAPTVVLQEASQHGGGRQEVLSWGQIQDIIASWKLGRN
ncbi:putative mitochondrial-processing peptidase subunit alpha mitochondrial precursor [Triangularia verruculosa]|uniref:Mitochondrial-processing peptidase subunit alpha n=1 Tax=Triangularia verruculosa TaxID=2587418 RepID=A0AAN7AWY9_9PEZI|nr:putative mitochondrial-processing peptidase subunit alpha mitochondrial precursor [Triangularia verruculosa]